MSKRQVGRSQAGEQASRSGFRSADLKDDSKIHMATWEIADALELVDAEDRSASRVATSGNRVRAA